MAAIPISSLGFIRKMNWDYSIKIASEAAKELIDDQGTRDLKRLYKARDLVLYECPDFDELKGMYAQVGGRRCVFVKSDLPQNLKNLILAHELGHDMLHQELLDQVKILEDASFVDMGSGPEIEANLFAAELLIDDASFLEMAQAGYSLSQMAASFGQREELLALKALILERQGYDLRLPDRYAGDFLLRA